MGANEQGIHPSSEAELCYIVLHLNNVYNGSLCKDVVLHCLCVCVINYCVDVKGNYIN